MHCTEEILLLTFLRRLSAPRSYSSPFAVIWRPPIMVNRRPGNCAPLVTPLSGTDPVEAKLPKISPLDARRVHFLPQSKKLNSDTVDVVRNFLQVNWSDKIFPKPPVAQACTAHGRERFRNCRKCCNSPTADIWLIVVPELFSNYNKMK